jgi:hypothetical protein
MSKKEIRENPYISHQHRGGIEYQIGITQDNIAEFDKYRTKSINLSKTVFKKGRSR